VRILVYSESYICRSLCPALFSLKRVLFLVILVVPVLGTLLSVVLADNTKQLTVRFTPLKIFRNPSCLHQRMHTAQ
jgi:hypothetical protein